VKTITQSAAGSHNARENWPALLEVAAREVFELMLGCRLTAAETLPDSPMDITAMVGLAGQLCGVMSVRCSKESSTIMASKMLGIEPSEVGAEMGDAFGEICNMVAGNFKNKISGLGDGCMLSVPTVIMGNDYSLHSLADAAAIELRLLFENMPVQITLQIHS
jgi:chemotaxis protein CheX